MAVHWNKIDRPDVSCASAHHGEHVPATYYMSAGNVGSYYCDACRSKISDKQGTCQVTRLGLHKRTMGGGVSKHVASNDRHLIQVLSRLDAAGDKEAADTIAWLIWWKEHYSVRFYETIHNTDAAELAPLKHMNE